MAELELFIAGEKADLFDVNDSPIKINYILIDLQFIDKRGGWSTSLKLPATKKNNQLLQFYNDTQTVNPERFIIPKSAQIFASGVNIFDGTVVGRNVKTKLFPEQYEVLATANNLSWVEYLRNLPIVDLDLPTVDWTTDGVKDSWTNTYTDKFVAPLCAYGRPISYVIDDTYPFGTNHDSWANLHWNHDDFRFWLFVYPLIKEMFAKSGYRLDSTFIESADFKKFCVYYNDTDVYHPENEDDDPPVSINFKTDLINADRKCFDLLKGIQNMFNLFFYTDDELKVVYCEPYDDFFSGKANLHDRIDRGQDTTISQYSQKIKNIIYQYQPDPVIKWLVEKKLLLEADAYTGGFEYLGNTEEVKVQNYFEGYSMGSLEIKGPDWFSMINFTIPFIFNDRMGDQFCGTGLHPSFAGLSASLCKYDLPEAKGTSQPKIGYYAGLTSLANGRLGGVINGDTGIAGDFFLYGSETFSDEIPYLYMCDFMRIDSPEKNFYYNDQEVDDIPYLSIPSKVLPGLVKQHYKNFLHSIQYGRYIDCPLIIKPSDINSQVQRKVIGLLFNEWALLEIPNYNAAKDLPTMCKLLERTNADQDFIDNLLAGHRNFVDNRYSLKVFLTV